jgi:long-chain acyl-CoA synthetase
MDKRGYKMKQKKEKFLWEHFYKEEDFNIKIPDMSLYEYMKKETKGLANYPAINYFGKKINYKTFWEYIDRCAKSLKSIGIGEGDVVSICLPNTPEVAIAFFAINKVGAIVNMIHPLSAEEEIKDYLNKTRSVVLIAFNQLYNKIKSIIKETRVHQVIFASASDSMPILMNGLYNVTKGRKEVKKSNNSFYLFWKDFLHLGDYYEGNTLVHRGMEDEAVYLHSGGTTGIPKSIVLANRSFTGMNEQSKVNFHLLVPGDSVLSILPMFHCFGLIVCMYVPICLGVTCIFIPQFDAKRFDKVLTKYKPVVMTGVPTLYEAILKNEHMDKVDLSQVKYVISGGDSVPKEKNIEINEFLKSHGSPEILQQGYGMTETTGPVCFGSMGSNKLGGVGAPMVCNIVRIIDPKTNKEVKPNEIGEICINSFVVMKGYLNNPKDTEATLKLWEDGRRYIHTGDLGYIDKDGVVFYVQRMKRIIISSGYNLYPQHIENVLRECEYVKDACVVGVPHPYKQEVAKAFIILEDGVEESYTVKKNIMDYAEKNLAHYMLPREYIYKKEFPKTKYFKTDYNKLRDELIKK